MSDYALLAVGVVLLVLGYILHIGILVTLGWVAAVVGLLLAVYFHVARGRRRSRL